MRNDIKELIEKLNDLYREKKELYTKLRRNTEECNFQIVSKKLEEIEDLLYVSNTIIDEVDNLDYDITQIKSELCEISGIEYHAFDKTYLEKESETNRILGELKPIIREALENREKLIKRIQMEQAKVLASIDSLSRTHALNAIFHIHTY